MIEENQSSTPPSNPDDAPIVGDTAPAETNLTEIPFPGTGAPKIKPNGTNLLIAWAKPEKAGEIFLPTKARTLDFITATVLAVGPEAKDVKEGDRIIIASKAIVNGDSGIIIDGFQLFFTQAQLILARIEAK